MADASLAERVEREKRASDEDDVLGRAFELKQRFHHVWRTTERVRSDEKAALDDIAGKRILDYGCGRGDFSLQLLERGAYVEGIDISQMYIDEAVATAHAAGFGAESCNFQVMDAHNLTLPENSFDYVVGNGILHHLDAATALQQINRVLKPGGRAIFQEPLAGNPLLKIFRVMTPKARTTDERPFSERDLAEIDGKWQVESRYYGMVATPIAMATSILLRPWPNNLLVRAAEQIDKRVGQRKAFRSWHQYVLFSLVKKQVA